MGSHLDLAIGVMAALAVVLIATLACGRLAEKVGQPRVVGEMVAGVLLGPSVFGAVLSPVQQSIFTPEVKSVLYVLSTIGLTFFMFLVGASIDHRFLDRHAVRRSASVAGTGLVLPFALGAGVSLLLAEQLAPPGSSPVEFAVLLGSALAVTAFPMLARILQERRMASTPMGSLALVAAAIDDAGAWALLAIVIALGTAGSMSGALVTIVGAALFAVFMLTVGRRLLRPLATQAERTGVITPGAMVTVLLVVIGCAWFTDVIGIYSVFGGFIAGLAMPASPILRRELSTRLMDMNAMLLLPVFFVFSGLNTRLAALTDLSLIPAAILIMVVAFAGKYLGCALAMRTHGFSWRHASAVGALMNARGLMVLIFINIGLAHGLISQRLFAILVLVALVTTASAMPVYRACFPTWLEDVERGNTARPAARPPDVAAPVLATSESRGRTVHDLQ